MESELHRHGILISSQSILRRMYEVENQMNEGKGFGWKNELGLLVVFFFFCNYSNRAVWANLFFSTRGSDR